MQAYSRSRSTRTLMTLFVAILFFSTSAKADDTPAEQALAQFNESRSAQTANRFLEQMLKEELIEKPIRFAGNTPLDTIQQQVWYWAGEYFYAQQRYDQAAEYAEKALPLFKDKSASSDCLNLLAITYIRLSDFSKAAHYAKQCYAIDEASGDADMMSSSLNTLAAIYMGANQPKEAEQYVLKGIEKAQQANNPTRRAVLQAMASEVYHALGNDQEALKHIDEAYRLDKDNGHEERANVRLAQKASVLLGLHQYGEAEQVLRQVMPFIRKSGDMQSLGIALNKLGMALLSQKRETEAVPFYREAASIFTKLGDPYNEVHARRGLYESLWKSDPDEAKHQLDRFNDLKDSIYNNVSAESLARYNAEFGNDWLKVENHEVRTRLVTAIILAVALALLAAAIWWAMRRRHRKQEAINEKLTTDIDELRENYRKLNVQYDKALTTQNDSDNEELKGADREFIEKSVNIINELINDGQIDAATVAGRMGMSLFQFRQRLNSITDETPQSFIQIIRMRRARHLLDNHRELNISEIARLCAYNDTPNFTRAFKNTFGLTPTQYLEKQN